MAVARREIHLCLTGINSDLEIIQGSILFTRARPCVSSLECYLTSVSLTHETDITYNTEYTISLSQTKHRIKTVHNHRGSINLKNEAKVLVLCSDHYIYSFILETRICRIQSLHDLSKFKHTSLPSGIVIAT